MTITFVLLFLRIGLLSFGGPAAQIALMQRELVDKHKLIDQDQFMHALAFCMLLPGPEAMQLATWVGWRLHGVMGGLIAGTLFVLPGALILFALAFLYLSLGTLPLVEAAFVGVKAVVVVIVMQALWRLAGKALHSWLDCLIALAVLIGIALFNVPYPVLLACAAGAGALVFARTSKARPWSKPAPPMWGLCAALLLAWMLPLALFAWGQAGFLFDIAAYFSKLAVISFGGAYAVLAYMSQTVVEQYGWISHAQMIDALGLAETTPGPLILVTQFVAVLAGADTGMGWQAGLVALWVTFVPCFLWIFAFAPWMDRIMGTPTLSAALRGVTAAVLAVIFNLAVWFASQVFFADTALITVSHHTFQLPLLSSLAPRPTALAVLAATLMLWRNWSILRTLGALAGIAALTSAIL